MGRVYDIVDKITNGNKKPKVKIDEDHEYVINNSKNSAIQIKAISEDSNIEDFERMDKIIGTALGEEALSYIDSLELPFPNYTIIVNVIMAAISDMSLEEMEDFSKKAMKSPRR